jgi:hypothetical protein
VETCAIGTGGRAERTESDVTGALCGKDAGTAVCRGGSAGVGVAGVVGPVVHSSFKLPTRLPHAVKQGKASSRWYVDGSGGWKCARHLNMGRENVRRPAQASRER